MWVSLDWSIQLWAYSESVGKSGGLKPNMLFTSRLLGGGLAWIPNSNFGASWEKKHDLAKITARKLLSERISDIRQSFVMGARPGKADEKHGIEKKKPMKIRACEEKYIKVIS